MKVLIAVVLGVLVGASAVYLTMPVEPKVEACYDYHILEMSNGSMVDTHLPEFDGCK